MMERSSVVRCERSGPWLSCRGTRGGGPRPWRSPSKEDSWFILQQQKSHFGLPPAENTVWPLMARVRSVWYVREREQKRLCFCSASEIHAESVEQISPRIGEVECGSIPSSPPSPSPLSPGPWGGAEVGVEVWCEAAAPLSTPTAPVPRL